MKIMCKYADGQYCKKLNTLCMQFIDSYNIVFACTTQDSKQNVPKWNVPDWYKQVLQYYKESRTT